MKIMQINVLLVPSGQRLAQPMCQTCPLSVFVKRVLLENSHIDLLPLVSTAFIPPYWVKRKLKNFKSRTDYNL